VERQRKLEGKYLTADVSVGDYILADKVSDKPAAENKYLYSLNGEKQAMSITSGILPCQHRIGRAGKQL